MSLPLTGLSPCEDREYSDICATARNRALDNAEFSRLKELRAKHREACRQAGLALARNLPAPTHRPRPYRAPLDAENYFGNPNSSYAQSWGD